MKHRPRLPAYLTVLIALGLGWTAQPAGAAPVTWTGTPDTTWTEIADATSFSAPYQDGDDVTFGATGVGAVTLSGTVAPGSVLINHASGNYTFDGGTLGGTGVLTKQGAGAVYFSSGATLAHGDTVIQGGLLQRTFTSNISNQSSSFGSGTITLDTGGRFHFNPSLGSNASATVLTNDFIVGAGGGTLSTTSTTGKTYRFSGNLSLGGNLTLGKVDGGGGGGPGSEFAGTIVIDQSAPGLRRLSLVGGGNHGPTVAGPIVDGPGGAGNPLVLSIADSSNARDGTLTHSGNSWAGGTLVDLGNANTRYVVVSANSTLGTGPVTILNGGRLRLSAPGNVAAGQNLALRGGGALDLAYSPTPDDLARLAIDPASGGIFTTLAFSGSASLNAVDPAALAGLFQPGLVLRLDNDSTLVNNRWPDAEPVTLHDNRLYLRGRNSNNNQSTEAFGALSFSGSSRLTLSLARTGASDNSGVKPVFASLAEPAFGATLLIDGDNSTDYYSATSTSRNHVAVTGAKPAMVNGMVSPGLQYYPGGNSLGQFLTFDGNNLVFATTTANFTAGVDTEIANAGSATLTLSADETAHALRMGQNVTVNSGVTLTLAGGGLLMSSNTLGGNGTVDFGTGPAFIGAYNASAQATISARVVARAGLTVLGSTQTLNFTNNANLLTGGIAINGGTVRLAGVAAAGNDVTVNAYGRLIGGPGGNGTDTIGGLSGTGIVSAWVASSGTSSSNLTLAPTGGEHTFDGLLANGAGSRKLGIVLAGSGTQVFGAACRGTYTGNTTVSSGTLLVHGSITGTPAVTVAPGAILGGAGTLAGAVTVNGTLAPGASVGTLTLSGNLTLAGDLTWEIGNLVDDATGTPGSDWDQLLAPAGLTWVAGTTLTPAFPSGIDPDSGDAFWDCDHSWTIASPGTGPAPAINGLYQQGWFSFAPDTGVLSYHAQPYLAGCPAAVLIAPADIGGSTAVVTWTEPVIAGNCGDWTGVTASRTAGPAPGSTFAFGDTTVTYTLEDGTGHTDTCTFIVRVVDGQPPEVTCPADMVVSSGGTGSAVITWTASALDNLDGPVGTVSLPVSGSVFSTGTTTVTVSATDSVGNVGQCSFTVTVDDTAPSVIGSGFTAALDALNAAAQNPFLVTVTFDDNHGMDSSTLGDGDVRLTGPGGYDAAGTLVGVVAGGGSGYPGKAGGRRVWAGFAPSGTQRTATYSFTPPGGAWTFEDNGTYTLALQNGAVTDLAGHPVPAGPLGTVAVDIINPPDSLSLDNNVLADGTGPGVTVGYLGASPTDKPVAYTFSLVAGDGDTDNALFSISGDALASAQTLLAETLGTAQLSVRLRVDNGAGGVLEQAFPIYLQVARLYVDQGAVGSFDSGVSWNDALLELSDAFAALQEPWGEMVTEIWVAAGTYQPGPAVTDTFPLWPQLAVYGGFAGGETDLAQRPDPFGLTTILDGANRARHVVTAIDAPADAVLDGFTIRRGQATGSGADEMSGGGLFVRGGAPTLRNLVLAENRASKLGGGAYLENTAATLENLTFWSNLSSSSGGGLHALGGSPALRRVSFLSNRASLQGGGLSLQGSPADVRNAVFQDNLAGRYGGGAYVAASAAWFRNCTFSQNRAAARGQAGALLIDRTSATTVRNSVFWDNTAPAYPEVYLLSPRTSRLFYCVVEGGQSYGTGIVTADPLLDPVTLVPAEGSSAIGLGVGVEPLDRAGAPRTRSEAGAFAAPAAP